MNSNSTKGPTIGNSTTDCQDAHHGKFWFHRVCPGFSNFTVNIKKFLLPNVNHIQIFQIQINITLDNVNQLVQLYSNFLPLNVLAAVSGRLSPD